MNWLIFKDRLTVFWFPFLVFLVLLVSWSPLHAKRIAKATQGGVVITLTDEPCTLTVVSNLPYKILWEEKGKTFTGCFTVNQGIVVAYFSDDKTVAIMPGQVFAAVTEL